MSHDDPSGDELEAMDEAQGLEEQAREAAECHAAFLKTPWLLGSVEHNAYEYGWRARSALAPTVVAPPPAEVCPRAEVGDTVEHASDPGNRKVVTRVGDDGMHGACASDTGSCLFTITRGAWRVVARKATPPLAEPPESPSPCVKTSPGSACAQPRTGERSLHGDSTIPPPAEVRRFYCPTCTAVGVIVDEDGCCKSCGTDAESVAVLWPLAPRNLAEPPGEAKGLREAFTTKAVEYFEFLKQHGWMAGRLAAETTAAFNALRATLADGGGAGGVPPPR